MRIEEIQKVGFVDMSDIGLTTSEIDSAELAATVMRLEMYHIKKGNIEIYFIKHEGTPIAWVMGRIYEYRPNRKALCVKTSFVDVNHRNKGIISNMYKVLNQQLKLSILSDVTQSADAIGLWKSLYSHNKYIQKMDSMTGEISDIDDINSMYGDENPYVFLLELTPHECLMYENSRPLTICKDIATYPCEAYFGRP
jgi:hypothetical protein